MSKLQRVTVSSSPPSRVSRLVQALRARFTGPVSISSHEWEMFYGRSQTAGGIVVDEGTALTHAAVWNAVGLIASQLGTLPCVLNKKLKPRGKQRYTEHPLYRLVHDRSNPETSAFIFRETLQAHVLLWGNAYAEIERDGANRPIGLWPLTPDRVTPFRASPNARLQYKVTNRGASDTYYDAADMLHIPGLGFDGVCGYSVIAKARESMGLGMATERFGSTFFGNGSTFGGILAHPSRLTEPARKNLVESLQKQHQGVERAHKFVILEEGMKYEKVGIPPNEAQFLETRTFQIDEIARWFNLPPHKLKELARSTNNNIEEQNLEYLIDCLSPWLKRWEQELNEKLISPLERNTQQIEFITDGLLRADSAGRGESYSKGFSVGALTPNDIRDKEDLIPLDGGDEAFVPFNAVPLSMVRQYWQTKIDLDQANIEKLKAPPPAPPTPDPGAMLQKQREIDQLTADLATARRCQQEAEDATGLAVAEVLKQAEADRVTAARAAGAAQDALSADFVTAQGAWQAERLAAAVALTAAETAATELRTTLALVTGERDAAAEKVLATLVNLEAVAVKRQTAEAERDALANDAKQKLTEILTLQDRLVETQQAVRAAVVDRVAWLIDRESDRARRVQQSPDKLRKWIEPFYADYGDLCRSILRPSVRAWLVCTGSAEPLEHVLDVLIGQHLEQSVRQLRTVADAHDADTLAPALEKLLRRWELDRADTLVTRVLEAGA
jgi:HK97 family phage portal protein